MFSKKESKSSLARTEPSSNDSKLDQNSGMSILAEGCTFQGKMFLRGNARIAGVVDGTIVSNHSLVLEPSAQVKGQISGVKVLVCGKIDGHISASELVQFTATSFLEGDVEAPRFIVDDGATLNGRLKTQKIAAPKSNNVHSLPLKNVG